MTKKSLLHNEKGSLSIEFMGLLPFIAIVVIVFFQVIGTGFSLLLAQKAVHESAKVYSITGSELEARDALDAVIGSSSILSYSNFSVTNEGDGFFTVKITGEHGIVFGPDSWRRIYDLPHYAYSRMIE